MTLAGLVQSDYKRYRNYGGNLITILFFTQGFWASFQYRVAHLVFKKIRIPVLRQLLLFFCLVWQKGIEVLTGISIPASAEIGHSFYIGHFGGIILNATTKIGNHCNISQGVTIGVSGLGEKRGVPVIENFVYIGAHAVIAGPIKVGNNAVVGANSFVNKDVADFQVVLGVPAMVISEKGSEGYI